MDDPITNEELDQLSALVGAASPAPWEAFIEEREPIGGCSFIRLGGLDDSQPDMYVYHENRIASAADLDFIAAARLDLPRLLAEVCHLRAMP